LSKNGVAFFQRPPSAEGIENLRGKPTPEAREGKSRGFPPTAAEPPCEKAPSTKPLSKKALVCIASLAVIAGITALGICLWHLHRLTLLTSAEELRGLLEPHRGWAPFLIVVIQCLQVLLAPIPGQAISVASGYLFGPVMGTVYSMIGLLLGSFLAMVAARKLGRPLVERFIPPHTLHRLDDYARRGGVWFFLAAFLFPFLPDDALCFLAGLSPLPIPLLLLISAIGRLPGVAAGAMAGAGISRLTLGQMGVLAAILAPIAIVAVLYRNRLQERVLQALRGLMR